MTFLLREKAGFDKLFDSGISAGQTVGHGVYQHKDLGTGLPSVMIARGTFDFTPLF